MNNSFEINVHGDTYGALMKMFDSVKHTDIAEEFILPDYLPDIKRIIRVDSVPKIDGKFVSSGKVDYEGDVSCHILFCDEGNHLKTVTFTLSFSDGVEIPDVKDECVANLIPTPESVSCKMLNPRRIAIRMRLDTSVTVWCQKSFAPDLNGDIPETGMEKSELELEVMDLICAGESGLNASADIEARGALPQIGENISCTADISFYECKPSDEKVLCRGDASVTVFYSSQSDDGEQYTVLFRKFPLAQVVAAEGVNENYSCMSRGNVDNINFSIAENGFGENRIIELDITYRVYLNCVGKKTVTVTQDLYAAGKNVRTECKNELFCKFSKLYSTSFGANLVVKKEELNLSNAENVFALSSQPKITSVELSDDKSRVNVTGFSQTSAIVKDADGLVTHEYQVPFKLELEAQGVKGNFIYNYDIVCMSAKGRFDSENFYTELDLQLNLMLLETSEVTVLRKAEITDIPETAELPQMRFYYPSEDETLWEIGKVFGVSQKDLIEKNNLSSDKLPRVLFIPTFR